MLITELYKSTEFVWGQGDTFTAFPSKPAAECTACVVHGAKHVAGVNEIRASERCADFYNFCASLTTPETLLSEQCSLEVAHVRCGLPANRVQHQVYANSVFDCFSRQGVTVMLMLDRPVSFMWKTVTRLQKKRDLYKILKIELAWHWLNIYGCFFPAVCWAPSHWRPLAVAEVSYSIDKLISSPLQKNGFQT